MVDDVNANKHGNHARREDNPGNRRKILTHEKLQSHAIHRLGYPHVDVEITAEQFEDVWERTLDEYNRWLPTVKFDILNATGGRQKYDLEALNKPFGRGVFYATPVTREDFFSPISGVFALGIPHPISHLSPDQYDIALKYIDESKKVYSSDFDWEWQEPVLWAFSPSGFGGPVSIAYQYHTDAENPEDVNAEDRGLVKEYYFNLVKEMVGYARRKFGAVPGPNSLNLDGGELVSEAQAKIEKLEEDMQSKSYGRVPPIGPGGF